MFSLLDDVAAEKSSLFQLIASNTLAGCPMDLRPRDEFFPKSSRLIKRSEFLAAQRFAQKFHTRSFLGLVVLSTDAQKSRIGITTSKKVGNAVQRNHIRRLIRESFRRHKLELLPGFDIVVIAKKNAALISNDAIFDELALLGKKVRNGTVNVAKGGSVKS